MTLTAVAGAKAARLEAATIGRSVKLLDLVRQLAPLLRQIEIHQSRFQRDRLYSIIGVFNSCR